MNGIKYHHWIILIFLCSFAQLFHDRGRYLSYRNQSIDLLCKSMDWFLYDNGTRHQRVKTINFSSTLDFVRITFVPSTFVELLNLRINKPINSVHWQY